ncbi:LysE family translocator [Amycolatopsis minnesotensis]|uniref:LysE family translocator n=1 Tax=Amycolatopsis minnesotensis TaxID=337894 RepID=A0ABN2RNW8_9PSEU
MSWGLYWSFVLLVALLAIAPGPDSMVVLKNALSGGARGGLHAAGGIACANVLQGTAAALGLGALITRSQPVFQTVRWLGVAYLCYLGFQALRGAWKGNYDQLDDPRRAGTKAFRRWREGFLSNMTNPKVLVMYLSLLPQFLHPGVTTAGDALLLAYTVAVLGGAWQLALLFLVHRVRNWISRRRVRRGLDGATGAILIGFGAAMALES